MKKNNNQSRFILRYLLAGLILFTYLPAFAQNEDNPISSQKIFDGLYLGANIGSQNIFGGSNINGLDVLAQESRMVVDFSSGFRKQFLKNRFLFGIEVQFGLTDGTLKHSDQENQLEISYKNKTQYGIGITTGVTLGKHNNFLILAYLNETKRKFDVMIIESIYHYTQQDKQGILKYGIGVEARVYKRLNVRFTIGGLRVDFGDLETNIDVEDKLDVTLGVIHSFFS